jgi:PAS domain S-box-containing protein
MDKDNRPLKGREGISPEDENQILKSQIAAFEQLLEVYEKSVLDNSEALYAEIARRKEVGETLQTSRLQLSEAMDLARIVYWEMDLERGLFIFNDAFYTFCGTSAEQEGGYLMSPEEYAKRFIYPEDQPLFLQLNKKIDSNMDQESFIDVKHRLVRSDGEVLYILARLRIFKDAAGRVIRIFGANQDITERRHAEDALKKNAHFQQILIDAIPNPVFYKDVSGIYQGCNKAFESYIGRNKSEIVGKSVYDISPKELADRYHEMDMALFNQGGVQIYDSSVRYADGTIHDIIFNKAIYIDSKGSQSGLVGVILDITERKKMEEALRTLNDELERKVEERTNQLIEAQEELVRKEKLAILGQLAGIVGHEIRNPLGVMSNAVYFLRTVMPEANDTIREYLDIIKKEIDNSLRIITDLLDFARTRPPHAQTVVIASLINQGIKKCLIPENIAVDIDTPESLPLLWVDPNQIEQVFHNLITNAVQAMPEGGALRISARRGSRDQMSEGSIQRGHEIGRQSQPSEHGFIEIMVSDTGIGISPENMKRLFQPLFTTKSKGIGLGLVVCKNSVEANGGRINVESILGKGTSFIIMLPIEGGNV